GPPARTARGACGAGGIRVRGNSGSGWGPGHWASIAGGSLPIRDGELQWEAPGVPELRVAIVPRTEVTFTDGWHVQGLKGTGSYDYQLRDLFVPAHRTYALFATEPHRRRSPAFRMGL